MQLTILAADRFARIGVEKRTVDGDLVAADRSTFAADRDFARAAAALGIPKRELVSYIDQYRRAGTSQFALTPPVSHQFSIIVRGRTQPAIDGKEFKGEPLSVLRAILEPQDLPKEPLLCWDDEEQLCAVDVDFATAPPRSEVEIAAELSIPRAPVSWSTRHGGLRLLFTAQDMLRANELAALAALWCRNRWRGARVELKTDTRHPGTGDGCGEVRWRTPTVETAALRGYFSARAETDATAVGAWLAERNLTIGQRYAHEHCPVQPSPEDQVTYPVLVQDDHIHCFRCGGKGVTYGSSIPGRFTYTALMGTGTSSALAKCAEHFSHWAHARHVVEAAFGAGMPTRVLRSLYSAILTVLHGSDPRIRAVFSEGLDLIRLDGRWATSGGEEYHAKGMAIRPILQRLPAVLYVDGDGEPAIDFRLVAKFEQPHDLWPFGYPALTPVWSIRVYGQHLGTPDATRIPVVMQVPRLAPQAMTPYRARYLEPAARVANPWSLVEAAMPGVDRKLVKLLIAAKGAAESGLSMPPLIVITGPSGAGKTSVVELAAAIAGDERRAVTWNDSDDRVRQQIISAKESGSYVVFNEFFKSARRGRKPSATAVDLLLGLTPDSTSHKMYIGPVRLGQLPVCIWTDIAIPDEVRTDVQIARRLTHAHIGNRHDWRATIVGAVGQIECFRTRSMDHAAAANAILSEVIDEFFSVPYTFAQIAGLLGYRSLEESSDLEWSRDLLRDFFFECCALPDAQSSRRKANQGWKAIDVSGLSQVARLWKRLRDTDTLADSRKCREVDWQELCGLAHPAEFRCRGDDRSGLRVEVRWMGRDAEGNLLLNQELCPNGTLPDRSRDGEPN
jgi:hypothetical protein